MKFYIFIFLLFACSNTALAQSCNLRLTGHVEDMDFKEKLEKATVEIKELNIRIVTDIKGDFAFTGMCLGEYTLVITHANCDSVEKKVSVNKNVHIDILLPHARQTLGDIVVEAQKGIANTGFKKELSGKALEQTKGLSLAEALSNINGVTMLQTGSTIAKPVIHGLHSNRILTINNGIRQEGQQWGNEHAPEIDPFIAAKLVVIKGVDELKYGSDAIGGVILVEPKALRNNPGYNTEINTAYFTNNKQYVVSAQFEQQLKKLPQLTYRLQGTFKKGANATTPNYRLNNTASEEKNFSGTVGWKKNKFTTELFYSHFETTIGIFTGAHIGNLTDLINAIAASKPNDVYLGQNSYKIKRPSQAVKHDLLKSKTVFYKGEHKFSILLGGQFNQRKEFDVVRSSTNKTPQLDLSIYTLSEDFTWESPKKNKFNSMAGLSLSQQNNKYTGRYFIPNYATNNVGGYFIEKWSKHKWELQGGIRFDNKSINTTRLKSNGDTINFDFNFSTTAASLNAVFKPNTNWKLNTNISLANRAPHVNELLSNGIHHGTATYEKGNIALKPEQSLNITTGINFLHEHKKWGFDIIFYSNNIRNFIYQQPVPNRPFLTTAGAFPLMEYRQVDALLNGFDIATNIKPIDQLEWQLKFSFLQAKNKTLNDWLILMPANRLTNEFTYTFKNSKKLNDTYVSVDMMNVLQQTKVPSDNIEKQDYKTAPKGYNLINLHASTTIALYKTPITFSVGVKNLLNTTYRDYLNGLRYFTDEMGRNISIRLKIII